MGAPFDGSAQLRPDSRAQNSAAWRDRERAAEMTLTLEHCRLHRQSSQRVCFAAGLVWHCAQFRHAAAPV